jgi:hypothetical protein
MQPPCVRILFFPLVHFLQSSVLCTHGIGGFGTGATPQTADAQGGSGGVGIRNSLP